MRIGNFSLNSTEIFCSNICFSSKENKILERILALLAAWRITKIICSMAFLQFTCMYSKSLIIGMTRYRKNVLIIKFINNGFIKILVFNDILFSKKIPMVEECIVRIVVNEVPIIEDFLYLYTFINQTIQLEDLLIKYRLIWINFSPNWDSWLKKSKQAMKWGMYILLISDKKNTYLPR